MSGPRWDAGQEGNYDDYIKRVAAPQIAELVTRLQPAVLWFDIPNKGLTPDQVRGLMASFPRNPGMIYNNRMGGGVEGDIETPEQTIPATGFPGRDWETCMTINDTWGYKAQDTNFKPTAKLLRNLVDIASKGGNYLLNVGPDDKGLIPAPEVARLAEMGNWTKVNEEAVYGTTASPFKKQLAWGRATQRPGKLYLHVFDWPTDVKLVVPGLKSKVTHAYLLADPGKAKLAVSEDDESKVITVGGKAPDPVISVIVLEVEGDPEVVTVFIKPTADGSIPFPAGLADLHADHGGSPQLQGQADSKCIGCWTNNEAWVSWEFTGAKPGTYEVVANAGGPDDSKATVEIGNQKLPVSFTKTKGYNDCQSQVLGRIQIAAQGGQQLAIRPDKDGWKAVNLKQVTLRPVAGHKQGETK